MQYFNINVGIFLRISNRPHVKNIYSNVSINIKVGHYDLWTKNPKI